jgi:hypothetical protein
MFSRLVKYALSARGLVLTSLIAAAVNLVGPTQPAFADDADLPAPDRLLVSARYAGSILMFRVGEVSLSAELGAEAYFASTAIRAAGLAALFTDFDIRAEVSGTVDGGVLEPVRYAHVERTGDKVRAVDVTYPDRIATAAVEPPFGSLGQPPATQAQRAGAIDPMSAVFQLSEVVMAQSGEICSGRISVFDGKARYDLRLQVDGQDRIRTRAWRGEALICQIWYEPVAGYDPEDYPSESELRHPLTVWLAPFEDGRFHIPVRMHTRAGFGGVTIEAVELDIAGG